MSDDALKPATLLTSCVINVDRAWHVPPKQPRLKSGPLCASGYSSTDGLSVLTIITSVNQLKQVTVTELGKLPQRLADRTIGHWRRRLGCVVQQQGGHIEHLM